MTAALLTGSVLVSTASARDPTDTADSATSVSVATESGRSSRLQGNLAVTSTRLGNQPAPAAPMGLVEGWDGAVAFQGKAAYEDLLSLELRGDFFDERRLEDHKRKEFDLIEADLEGWEDNSVADVNFKLGLFGDRLRFTSRGARSRYGAPESYLNEIANDSDKDEKGRFLDHEGAEGTAFLHRLDATWNVWNAEVATFAEYSKVESFFEVLEPLDKKRKKQWKKDPFREPDNETTQLGTTFGLGPIKLTVQRELTRELEEDDEPELSHGASAWLDLEDIRSRAGATLAGPVWAWLPGTAWVSLSEGRVERNDVPGDRDDKTSNISFGLSWDWDGSYASADFWRSLYDGRGAPADEYDWSGFGADVALGFDDGVWNADVAFGLSRSEDHEATSSSTDIGYDASLSLRRRMKNLPDITSSMSVGYYGFDYGYYDYYESYDNESRTNIMDFRIALDFSKYLRFLSPNSQPVLKMSYQFENDYTNDGSDGEASEADHRAVVFFQLKF